MWNTTQIFSYCSLRQKLSRLAQKFNISHFRCVGWQWIADMFNSTKIIDQSHAIWRALTPEQTMPVNRIWLAKPLRLQCLQSSQPLFRGAKQPLGPPASEAFLWVTRQQNPNSTKSEHPWALWGLAVPFLMSCAFVSSLSLCGPGIWSSAWFLTKNDRVCCCGCLVPPSSLYCSCNCIMYMSWYSCACLGYSEAVSQDTFPAVTHSSVLFFLNLNTFFVIVSICISLLFIGFFYILWMQTNSVSKRCEYLQMRKILSDLLHHIRRYRRCDTRLTL